MKICVASDSWAWAWGVDLKSQTLQDATAFNPIYSHEGSPYPQLQLILEMAGHEMIYAGAPAIGNSEIVELLREASHNHDFDVVWYFFTHPHRDSGEEIGPVDAKVFAEVCGKNRLHALQDLNILANDLQVPVLLMGGAGKVTLADYRKTCHSEYLHLVTPSLIEHFTDHLQDDYMLASWWQFIEAGQVQCLQFANDIIYRDDLIRNHYYRGFLWPCGAHPGITGQTLVADLCFKYMEDNGLLTNATRV
jgi:hypothetical protein